VNVWVAPTPETEALTGVMTTEAAGCRTVTDAEPDMSSVAAVMVVCPFPMEVASPDAFTVAQVSSDDDHVNVLPEIVFPLASSALAVN
jgi:hypothetical protein